jgi:hypothetical protein
MVDIERRTTYPPPFETYSPHSRTHPLEDQILFQFCDRSDDDDHRPAQSSAGVDVLSKTHELDANVAQFVENFEEMPNRSGHSIEQPLGRTEPHVLSSLDAVMNVLHKLAGSDKSATASEGAPALGEGAGLLEKNTEALLGANPAGRNVRIMVTMPPEAATNHELVRDLLAQGMDCKRINCAHDGAEAWSGMIQNLRRAEKETNKRCKVLMDLAGPKLRTGSVEPGPAVLKYRPQRDTFGRVVSPARIWLTPTSCPEVAPGPADAVVPVPQLLLARLRVRDRILFTDARGASRSMIISGVKGESRWADAVRTAYIFPGMILETRRSVRTGVRLAFSALPLVQFQQESITVEGW